MGILSDLHFQQVGSNQKPIWGESIGKGTIHFLTSTRRGKGTGSGGRMWMEERCQAPCGRQYRKLKLESTDVILSSSHAKKFVSFFYQNFVFGRKKWKFFCDIN